MRSRIWISPTLLIGLLILCFMPGCDKRPTRVPVSGQVLIDGQPLTYGSVRFVPSGARLAQGSLDKEGRFSLTCYRDEDGTVLGSHGIVVNAAEAVNETTIHWHAPKKYAELNTSGLTQEIFGPINALVINLSWSGGKPFDEIISPTQ